jgi:hypothetical protein
MNPAAVKGFNREPQARDTEVELLDSIRLLASRMSGEHRTGKT